MNFSSLIQKEIFLKCHFCIIKGVMIKLNGLQFDVTIKIKSKKKKKKMMSNENDASKECQRVVEGINIAESSNFQPYHAIFPISIPKMNLNPIETKCFFVPNNEGSKILAIFEADPIKCFLFDIKTCQWTKFDMKKSKNISLVDVKAIGKTNFIILLKEDINKKVMCYFDTYLSMQSYHQVEFGDDPLFSFFYENDLYLIYRDSTNDMDYFIGNCLSIETLTSTIFHINGSYFPDCTIVYSSCNEPINEKILFHTNSNEHPLVVFNIKEKMFEYIDCDPNYYTINRNNAQKSSFHLLEIIDNTFKFYLVSSFKSSIPEYLMQIGEPNKFSIPEEVQISNIGINAHLFTSFSLGFKAVGFFTLETYLNMNIIAFGPPERPPKPEFVSSSESNVVLAIPNIDDWYLSNYFTIDVSQSGTLLLSMNLCEENNSYNVLRKIKVQLKDSEEQYSARIVAHHRYGTVESEPIYFIVNTMIKWNVNVMPEMNSNDEIVQFKWNSTAKINTIRLFGKENSTSIVEPLITIEDPESTGVDLICRKKYLYYQITALFESGEEETSQKRRKIGAPWQRFVFSLEQKNKLQDFFNQNRYPDEDQINAISSEIGVPISSIKTWFANMRHRNK